MMFNMKNGKENDILKSYNVFHQDSSHILYINSLRLYVTGPGVQADRARRGEWGKERSVIHKPGSALPDFDLTKTRSHLPAQTSIVSSCIGNYLLYNVGFPICFFGALIPFYVCVFAATKKNASVLIKVPKKPQDLALQNCVSKIFFLCLVFIIFACLAISSKTENGSTNA